MQAASFRNSSISLVEKLSTKERDEEVIFSLLYGSDITRTWILVIESSHFIVFTATFSDVPLGCFKWPSITEPNSPDWVKPQQDYSLSVFIWMKLSGFDYSLTLSKNLPYREQVPCDHHVLKFSLKFFANTKVPHCREDPHFIMDWHSQNMKVYMCDISQSNPKHTCDSDRWSIVGSLGFEFYSRLQFFSTSKQPPAGGDNEKEKNRMLINKQQLCRVITAGKYMHTQADWLWWS